MMIAAIYVFQRFAFYGTRKIISNIKYKFEERQR
jgi:hypothetical protein